MDNKAKLVGTRYVLAVKDLNKSVEFYTSELGFKVSWSGDGWSFLNRDKCTLMLGECSDDVSAFETNNHSYFAYIDVTSIDFLFEDFKAKEIELLNKVEDKPWGQREFGIRTPDGHRIMFGEEIKN